MKLRIALVIAFFIGCLPVFAGTIVGTVHAEGKAGADDNSAAPGGEYASRKYKFVPKMDYTAMHDFVVYIEGPVGTNRAPATNVIVNTKQIAQHGAQFAPHILPVMAGTTVEWPNNDDIYHNVFSMSDAKQFDLGLYKGDPPDKRVTFDKPGRVDVFCSIHQNMHCVVLVLENPFFATTDENGDFKIPDVPPGTYKLKAWQERLPPDEREIVVPTNGNVRVDFTLTIKNLPQY